MIEIMVVMAVIMATSVIAGIVTRARLRTERYRVRGLFIELKIIRQELQVERECFWKRHQEYRRKVAADPDLQREEQEDLEAWDHTLLDGLEVERDATAPVAEGDDAAYTAGETRVMSHLVVAWNLYVGLPRDHPDDVGDFKDGIHLLQRIILANVALRDGRKST